MLRILAATGILRPVSENVYAHNKFSLAYIDSYEVDFYTLWQDPHPTLSGVV